MRYRVVAFLYLLGGLVRAQSVCELDDIFAQTDILLATELIEQYPAAFPNCQCTSLGPVCYSDEEHPSRGYFRFSGDGAVDSPSKSAQHFAPMPSPAEIKLTPIEREGTLAQLHYLARAPRVSMRFADRKITLKDLKWVARCLDGQVASCRHHPSSQLSAYRLSGYDGRGNVQFTGYFTPELQIRKQPDAVFKVPILKRPKSTQDMPSRAQIEAGALADQKLEIGYTDKALDLYFLQIQGSGIAIEADGSSVILAYDGKNGHPYTGIGRLLVQDGKVSPRQISMDAILDYFKAHPEDIDHYVQQNPSYVFFKARKGVIRGASGAALLAGHSIAVDPSIIPYGSILLAQVPIINENNQVVRHEMRLLFAQDTGSAIKGADHVDLYTGIGAKARDLASHLHHYGQVWLLLPRL